MNKSEIKQLPYRKNVSCIVFKDDQFLLVQLMGWPNNWWKFPQGGIELGETVEAAAQRELLEELGLPTETLRFISSSANTHQYDWSEESARKAGFRWRGQIQRFLFIEFLGTDEQVKANSREIQKYKWVDANDVLREIDQNHPDFLSYRNAVAQALLEFKELLI